MPHIMDWVSRWQISMWLLQPQPGVKGANSIVRTLLLQPNIRLQPWPRASDVATKGFRGGSRQRIPTEFKNVGVARTQEIHKSNSLILKMGKLRPREALTLLRSRIYSFSKHFLSICPVPDSILGARDIAVAKSLSSLSVHSRGRRQITNRKANKIILESDK